MPFDTLEAAQAEIVRLNESITEITNERDTLSQNNETLKADVERLRTLNQNYFNKLAAQYVPQDDKNTHDGNAVTSCEDFAKTLTI